MRVASQALSALLFFIVGCGLDIDNALCGTHPSSVNALKIARRLYACDTYEHY